MLKEYLSLAYLIVFSSFIVGSIITASIRNSTFYDKKLSNLNFIKSEKTNKIIGVGIIKWVVKFTIVRHLNQKIKIDKKKLKICNLYIIRMEMNKSEIDHLFGFVSVFIFVIFTFSQGNFLFGSIVFLLNIFMNLYPSLLQQQNKRRIDKLIARFER